MKKLAFVVYAVIVMVGLPALAWDGYDYETDAYVEINKGNLVRKGETIEAYDYNTGNYHQIDVENIQRKYDGGAEIEVYDHETGEKSNSGYGMSKVIGYGFIS